MWRGRGRESGGRLRVWGRGGADDLQREMFWVCLSVMWTVGSRASVLDFIDFDDRRMI